MSEEDPTGNRKTFFHDVCEHCGYEYFKWPWKTEPNYRIKSNWTKAFLICGKCGKLNIVKYVRN